jgi:sugar transferase (PEP-CTERM system associated)
VANLAVMLVAIKFAFFWTGLYDFRHLVSRRVFWNRISSGFALVYVGACVALAIGDQQVVCLVFIVAFAPVVLLARFTYEFLTRIQRHRRRLLFMGIGDHAQRTAREILDDRSRDYEIVGFLAEKREEEGWRIGGRSVLGVYADLEHVVERERVDQVVVAVADRRKLLPLEALLRVRLHGVEVLEEAKIHEEITGKIPVEDLRPSWLIFSEGFSNSALRNVTKRMFDVVVSTVVLILSAPFALLVALAVKLDSPGPVFFKQKRVGQGGREFTVYKFRSMRNDAEQPGKPVWASQNDPRVTRVGRLIRKTRIDELPQLWNVLQGTMSLVGPRPERLFFTEKLRERIPFYDQRHAVKPGITGWAQVRFRYGADESDAVEKLRHDMFYIKHHSIMFDLRILLETIRVIFSRDMGR